MVALVKARIGLHDKQHHHELPVCFPTVTKLAPRLNTSMCTATAAQICVVPMMNLLPRPNHAAQN